MKEIPRRNYFIVIIIAVVVVVLAFVLMNMYHANHKEAYDSVIKDVINEIKYDDLDSYLTENPDAVIYINKNDKDNKKLEEKIKKLIVDNDIQQYFVYCERTKDIVKRYDLKDDNPVFVAYKNGEIVEIYSTDDYTVESIESFLVRTGVIDND